MRIVIQRVTHASVSVEEKTVAEIQQGLLILVGIGKDDTDESIKNYARKIVDMRIMADDSGKFNRSVKDTNGEILVVSQFTLLADTTKGNRPSFTDAALPDTARQLYELFINQLLQLGISKVVSGQFGAYMKVRLVNDGPVTIVL